MELPTALITGASSGLGWEYALQLARLKKYRLLLTARREERLEELRELILRERSASGEVALSADVELQTCDLRKEEDVDSLISTVKDRNSRLEVLINNAGFGSLGPFVESELSWERDMLKVNCLAPLTLTHAFLPEMLSAKRGMIVNVCSTAAYQAMPYMATYGGSKAFLLSFTLAVAAEVGSQQDGSNIRIMAHCPGPTPTEFHLVVGLEDKLTFLPAEPAETVVANALKAALNGSYPVYINGWINRLGAFSSKLLPSGWAAWSLERVLRREARKAGP